MEEIIKDANFYPIQPILHIKLPGKPPLQVPRRQGWCLSAHHWTHSARPSLLGTWQVLQKNINKEKNKIYKIDLAKIVTFPIQSVHKVDQSVINAMMLILKRNTPCTSNVEEFCERGSHWGVLESPVSLPFSRLIKIIILLNSLAFLPLCLVSFFWLTRGVLRHCKVDFNSAIWTEAVLSAICFSNQTVNWRQCCRC